MRVVCVYADMERQLMLHLLLLVSAAAASVTRAKMEFTYSDTKPIFLSRNRKAEEKRVCRIERRPLGNMRWKRVSRSAALCVTQLNDCGRHTAADHTLRQHFMFEVYNFYKTGGGGQKLKDFPFYYF